MPRSARQTPAGYVYHALNRATARRKLFRKAADYAAFLRVFDEALVKQPLRVLGYCLMPTHWHVVLSEKGDSVHLRSDGSQMYAVPFFEVAMFRVVGRDAQGQVRELSINASTEQEAEAIARRAGIVTIDRVSSPSPIPPQPPSAGAGRVVGGTCLCGVLGAILGVVVGLAVVARSQEMARNHPHTAPLGEHPHTAPQDPKKAIGDIAVQTAVEVTVGTLGIVMERLFGAALGGIVGAVGGATVGAAIASRVRRK